MRPSNRIALIVSLLILPSGLRAQTPLDSLVPQPRQAYVRMMYSAVFWLAPSHAIHLDPDNPQWNAAWALNAGIRNRGFDSLAIRIFTEADTLNGGLYIGVRSPVVNTLLARIPDQRVQVSETYPGAEGYVLDVMAAKALVNGCDSAGLFYGIDTFLQLLSVGGTGGAIRLCRVVDAPEFPIRWYYYSTNIQVPANVTKAKSILDEAARYRLNGINLNDSKFSRITDVTRFYYDSLRSLNSYAIQRGMRVIPGIFPFGYSNSILYHDPDLASGLPVRNQLFRVTGDSLQLLPRGHVALPNGGFEDRNGNAFPGFRFIDQPGRISFADTVVKHGGTASIRFESFAQHDPQNGHGRISYWTRVAPFTQYHVSAWVRTDNLQPASSVNIAVLSNVGYNLAYNELAIPSSTGGWRKLDFTFNSLEADTVGIYWGVWNAKSGTIWWDDLVFEECALVNLIRREGAPLSVTNPSTGAAHREGIDIDSVRDPRCGRIPYNGVYDTYHTPPRCGVRTGGALGNGDTVALSYHHAITIYSGQVMATMSDPNVYRIIEREFRMLDSLLKPDIYFLQHDEIRTMNWDKGDQDRGLTPGQILASNVNSCLDIISRHNPAASAWVWSDMFDEYHNAVRKNYYLVNGDLTGSADLLPKSLGIVNWNSQAAKVQNSLSFFSGKGFRQISAPYYDAGEAQIRTWKERTRLTPGFDGMMYTTWTADYSRLEAFGEYAWNHAPYIYHDPPQYMPFDWKLPLYVEVRGDRFDPGWSLTDLKVFYRIAPVDTFSIVQAPPITPGQMATIDLQLPARSSWVQWYLVATDNRGWRTRIPFRDSVFYQIGDLATSAELPGDPSSPFAARIFPHPVHQGIPATIRCTARAEESLQIAVLDALGRVMRAWTQEAPLRPDTRIDLDGLRPGLYFLHVAGKTGHTSARFLVR